MNRYILAFHGGRPPANPEEGSKFMARWRAWAAGLGEARVAPGQPVGRSRTLTASGAADGGGANPLSGYSIITADSLEAAVRLAEGCPHLDHGTIEVGELLAMEM